MTGTIIEKIEALPPLPKTILDIEEFRKKNEKEAFELLQIIEKDALITSTLLKVSNSAMFGFRSKVETVSKAINLLGINFTISIAIGGTVQNLLKSNLSVYGINSDDFMRASNLATTLTALWLNKVSYDLKEELVLPALLQEAGKFILADVLDSEDKAEEFKNLISSGYTIAQAERECIGVTTSQITASIFRHWKLSENLISVIEHVDNLDDCDETCIAKSQILEVIKTICNIQDPLSVENIEKGIAKATSYKLDTKTLKEAIEKLEDRLLEE
ncbi:HDOD domain-containing protein [Halarcobacter bivalviorum]|uniref:HDOD domain-containing protein n=1 Tax=Halarcobacter bivalviorum TaxID=663364 RepID=UPI00100A3E80|nr:HDOD domain-containing protein [Halarcobacter bivalviorum]RXK08192.1 HDOD domain-containing protein [Halarcobacter bivalviorum]